MERPTSELLIARARRPVNELTPVFQSREGDRLNGTWPDRFRKSSEFFGLAVFTIGVLVLLGWGFNIPLLKSFLPEHMSMLANTAIGFIFSGFSLFFLREKQCSSRKGRLARILVVETALIATLFHWEFPCPPHWHG